MLFDLLAFSPHSKAVFLYTLFPPQSPACTVPAGPSQINLWDFFLVSWASREHHPSRFEVGCAPTFCFCFFSFRLFWSCSTFQGGFVSVLSDLCHSRHGSHQCGKRGCETPLHVQDFQGMLRKNHSLTGVLRLGLNWDVIASFFLHKIRAIIICRKFALLCFVAAAVALFKHFGCGTQIQTPKTGDGHCELHSGCPGNEGRVHRDSNESFHFVNYVWKLESENNLMEGFGCWIILSPTLLDALTERGIIKFKWLCLIHWKPYDPPLWQLFTRLGPLSQTIWGSPCTQLCRAEKLSRTISQNCWNFYDCCILNCLQTLCWCAPKYTCALRRR